MEPLRARLLGCCIGDKRPALWLHTSPGAEAVARRSGLSVAELLTPFTDVKGLSTVFRAGTRSWTIPELSLRLVTSAGLACPGMDEVDAACAKAVEGAPAVLSAAASGAADIPLSSAEDGALLLAQSVAAATKAAPGSTGLVLGDAAPWFAAWRRALTSSLRCLPQELFDAPVGVLLVASTSDPDPLAAVRDLAAALPAASSSARRKAPRPFAIDQFDAADLPKFYLILHDNAPSSLVAAKAADPTLTLSLPDAPAAPAGGSEAEAARPSAPQQHDPTAVMRAIRTMYPPQACFGVALNSYVPGTNGPRPPPAADPWAAATVAAPAATPKWLAADDVQSLRTLFSRLAAEGVIPAIESRLFSLSAAVASAKRGRITDVVRSWWGSGSGDGSGSGGGSSAAGSSRDLSASSSSAASAGASASAPSVFGATAAVGHEVSCVMYPAGCFEWQLRLHADLSFMIGDYEGAAASYKRLKEELRPERHPSYYAAASEMLAVCGLLAAAAGAGAAAAAAGTALPVTSWGLPFVIPKDTEALLEAAAAAYSKAAAMVSSKGAPAAAVAVGGTGGGAAVAGSSPTADARRLALHLATRAALLSVECGLLSALTPGKPFVAAGGGHLPGPQGSATSIALAAAPAVAAANTKVRDVSATLRRQAQAEGDGTLAAALLNEQAALAALRCWPPAWRKAGNLYVAAGQGYAAAGALRHAVRCFSIASGTFGPQRPPQAPLGARTCLPPPPATGSMVPGSVLDLAPVPTAVLAAAARAGGSSGSGAGGSSSAIVVPGAAAAGGGSDGAGGGFGLWSMVPEHVTLSLGARLKAAGASAEALPLFADLIASGAASRYQPAQQATFLGELLRAWPAWLEARPAAKRADAELVSTGVPWVLDASLQVASFPNAAAAAAAVALVTRVSELESAAAASAAAVEGAASSGAAVVSAPPLSAPPTAAPAPSGPWSAADLEAALLAAGVGDVVTQPPVALPLPGTVASSGSGASKPGASWVVRPLVPGMGLWAGAPGRGGEGPPPQVTTALNTLTPNSPLLFATTAQLAAAATATAAAAAAAKASVETAGGSSTPALGGGLLDPAALGLLPGAGGAGSDSLTPEADAAVADTAAVGAGGSGAVPSAPTPATGVFLSVGGGAGGAGQPALPAVVRLAGTSFGCDLGWGSGVELPGRLDAALARDVKAVTEGASASAMALAAARALVDVDEAKSNGGVSGGVACPTPLPERLPSGATPGVVVIDEDGDYDDSSDAALIRTALGMSTTGSGGGSGAGGHVHHPHSHLRHGHHHHHHHGSGNPHHPHSHHPQQHQASVTNPFGAAAPALGSSGLGASSLQPFGAAPAPAPAAALASSLGAAVASAGLVPALTFHAPDAVTKAAERPAGELLAVSVAVRNPLGVPLPLTGVRLYGGWAGEAPADAAAASWCAPAGLGAASSAFVMVPDSPGLFVLPVDVTLGPYETRFVRCLAVPSLPAGSGSAAGAAGSNKGASTFTLRGLRWSIGTSGVRFSHPFAPRGAPLNDSRSSRLAGARAVDRRLELAVRPPREYAAVTLVFDAPADSEEGSAAASSEVHAGGAGLLYAPGGGGGWVTPAPGPLGYGDAATLPPAWATTPSASAAGSAPSQWVALRPPPPPHTWMQGETVWATLTLTNTAGESAPALSFAAVRVVSKGKIVGVFHTAAAAAGATPLQGVGLDGATVVLPLPAGGLAPGASATFRVAFTPCSGPGERTLRLALWYGSEASVGPLDAATGLPSPRRLAGLRQVLWGTRVAVVPSLAVAVSVLPAGVPAGEASAAALAEARARAGEAVAVSSAGVISVRPNLPHLPPAPIPVPAGDIVVTVRVTHVATEAAKGGAFPAPILPEALACVSGHWHFSLVAVTAASPSSGRRSSVTQPAAGAPPAPAATVSPAASTFALDAPGALPLASRETRVYTLIGTPRGKAAAADGPGVWLLGGAGAALNRVPLKETLCNGNPSDADVLQARMLAAAVAGEAASSATSRERRKEEAARSAAAAADALPPTLRSVAAARTGGQGGSSSGAEGDSDAAHTAGLQAKAGGLWGVDAAAVASSLQAGGAPPSPATFSVVLRWATTAGGANKRQGAAAVAHVPTTWTRAGNSSASWSLPLRAAGTVPRALGLPPAVTGIPDAPVSEGSSGVVLGAGPHHGLLLSLLAPPQVCVGATAPLTLVLARHPLAATAASAGSDKLVLTVRASPLTTSSGATTAAAPAADAFQSPLVVTGSAGRLELALAPATTAEGNTGITVPLVPGEPLIVRGAGLHALAPGAATVTAIVASASGQPLVVVSSAVVVVE